MTLRLILETAPHPQERMEFRLADGQVVAFGSAAWTYRAVAAREARTA